MNLYVCSCHLLYLNELKELFTRSRFVIIEVQNPNKYILNAFLSVFQNTRSQNGLRRGSRFPHGDSMEISAATLARARSSIQSERYSRRDSAFNHNGSHKNFNNNNNNNINGIV